VIRRRQFLLELLAVAANAQHKAEAYRPDPSAWQSVGSGAWTAEDGDIIGHCEKGSHGQGFLLTREEFSDFRLTLSFWISPGGSSAILLREPRRKWGPSGDDRPGAGPHCGCQIAIGYQNRDTPTGTIGNVKPKKIIGAEGQWNDVEIICRGSEVRITIAGQRINRFNEVQNPSGVIGFKIPESTPEGFEVKFQDIAISPVS
jgi:3-keto-disaccharide hydrolase